MLIQANGERRRGWATYAFGGALIAAVGTKCGEWLVEAVKKRFEKKP